MRAGRQPLGRVRGDGHLLLAGAARLGRTRRNCVWGSQDQYRGVCGGVHYRDFRDKAPRVTGDPVFATVESLEPYAAEPRLLLASTGVERHSGTVHEPLRARWLAGD